MAYRTYLTNKGLKPRDICQNFTPNNPLVIVEYCHSGIGLISFLSILLDWANEQGLRAEMINKVKIHLLMSPRFLINFPMNDFCYVRQDIEHDFMIALANSDYFDDRLVIQYQYFKWDKNKEVPEFAQHVSKQALLMIKKIIFKLHERGLLLQYTGNVLTESANRKDSNVLTTNYHSLIQNKSTFFKEQANKGVIGQSVTAAIQLINTCNIL